MWFSLSCCLPDSCLCAPSHGIWVAPGLQRLLPGSSVHPKTTTWLRSSKSSLLFCWTVCWETLSNGWISAESSPSYWSRCPWFSGLYNLNPFHFPYSPLQTCHSCACPVPSPLKYSVPSPCRQSPLPIQSLTNTQDSAHSFFLNFFEFHLWSLCFGLGSTNYFSTRL